MILAIDFDGTISKYNTYPRLPLPEEIREGAWDILKQLQKDGHTLILWTCRGGRELTEAIHLCYSNGVFFDAYNEDCQEIVRKYGGQGKKIFADLYIDDMGINGIPGTWYEIYERLMKDVQNR